MHLWLENFMLMESNWTFQGWRCSCWMQSFPWGSQKKKKNKNDDVNFRDSWGGLSRRKSTQLHRCKCALVRLDKFWTYKEWWNEGWCAAWCSSRGLNISSVLLRCNASLFDFIISSLGSDYLSLAQLNLQFCKTWPVWVKSVKLEDYGVIIHSWI